MRKVNAFSFLPRELKRKLRHRFQNLSLAKKLTWNREVNRTIDVFEIAKNSQRGRRRVDE